MRNAALKFGFALMILTLVSASAFAQGRGRRSEMFSNGHDARHGRFNTQGSNQNWKCGVFVNCHDARDGRVDGRGRNRAFARGSNVGYRQRYNMNDYWQRRHLKNGTPDLSNRWRYRNRTWRNR